ncbi:hypothetical protein [Verrucomicrobium spinosum]|uniref:hypothetical protein n=1 Tax=Verrucomicrobium spinosum TaxID=2736 RepID=UPI0001744939|nr:hypothetical protein [Verrucomicrobium spinosum]
MKCEYGGLSAGETAKCPEAGALMRNPYYLTLDVPQELAEVTPTALTQAFVQQRQKDTMGVPRKALGVWAKR